MFSTNTCTHLSPVFGWTPLTVNLFQEDKGEKAEKGEQSSSTSGKTSMKSVLDSLGELWDQQQYDSEYNLDSFMHSLQ